MGTGTVRVRLYATAREAVGRPTIELAVPPGGLTVRELVRALEREWPALRPVLRMSRFARNDDPLGSGTTRVRPGDEIAVHPPYGGG